ncbi:MAG: hypothetical protein Q8R06_09720 [Polaromonas sp.]|uniref:hypothetical protein n=1 Tax=Polaromonas sp. TaxID=1869339 RepID=UPI0027332867|nr:hypothetical protein [Polaromonas sp.]MDP3797413.1 hypothetical protein [Polaromonas sp.]
MADYESRMIRGWRGRLDDEAANARQRVSAAPAQVVYIPGRESVSSDQLGGSTRWFNRVFGAERVAASLELSVLSQLKRRIRKSELTEEQIEARRAAWRKAYHAGRARQTAEQRHGQLEKKRAKRAMRTPEEIENERRWFREFRAKQTEDWRVRQNEGLQRRRLANPEMHKAINQRSSDRTRDARNERNRARYKADPEKVMQSQRLYRLANLERTRAMRHASYLRNKAKQTPSSN